MVEGFGGDLMRLDGGRLEVQAWGDSVCIHATWTIFVASHLHSNESLFTPTTAKTEEGIGQVSSETNQNAHGMGPLHPSIISPQHARQKQTGMYNASFASTCFE